MEEWLHLFPICVRDVGKNWFAFISSWGPEEKHRKKVKVKVTLVQALRLCTGRTAHRGSRGIALPFLDHGTRRGWGVSVTPQALFTPGEDPVPIVQEFGWAPGPVWTGAENLAPTGIRSPDRLARSQSLYRLSYTGLQAIETSERIIVLRPGIEIWCPEYGLVTSQLQLQYP